MILWSCPYRDVTIDHPSGARRLAVSDVYLSKSLNIQWIQLEFKVSLSPNGFLMEPDQKRRRKGEMKK